MKAVPSHEGGVGDDEEDEEETVELRVSASRKNRSGRRGILRKMSSSTSSRMAETTVHDHIQDDADPSTRRTSAVSILDFTKSMLSSASRSHGGNSNVETSPESTHLLPHAPGYKNAWKFNHEAFAYDQSRADDAKETQTRLKLLAFWQLLVTGFEVLKFSIGKRAKKYVMWLALDGHLFLGSAKNDKKSARSIFLADVYRVQKGNDSQSFTKSQSWRDARGKDNLTFSIHGRHGKENRIFAIQVWKTTVRNILFENFDTLLRMMKSDADGEFPYVAQRVIAENYALTGEVLTLRQVEDVLLREEDEKKPRELGGDRNISDEEGKSGEDSDSSEEEEDRRDILG